ncbi:class E sortase [Demequina capsici]|uniref:Class E sortase n=1 Tax=Demequina capsici TaxID=3075620 RepID=A0AA96JCX1_9MICO|nr:class E sortase [Demequina sp. PMTSA13]WNM27376.1 class E sortase [Demequina sp. PMTSA13]
MSHDATASEAPSPELAGPRHRRRGPHPLDRVLGVVGELLIAAGVLVGLFVVWQLFYTDVTADREQAQIVEDFVASVSAGDTGGASGSGDPTDDVQVVQSIPAEYQFTDDPPVMSEPGHADTFAVMYVPRWGADYAKPIGQGVDKAGVLNVIGIGHYPGTAMPGGLGNFAVAGHRTTYGKPFADIDRLQEGDSIVIQTADAWYVYTVTSHEIVLPTAVDVIAPVPDQPGASADGRYITLTSCHPRFSAAQRWVVHGQLAYWAPLGHGEPAEMLEGTAS